WHGMAEPLKDDIPAAVVLFRCGSDAVELHCACSLCCVAARRPRGSGVIGHWKSSKLSPSGRPAVRRHGAGAPVKEPGNVEAIVRRGDFVVRMGLAAILGLSIRRSVETRMAVGQLAFFRSVGRYFADAKKNADMCRFQGRFDGSTL